MFVYWLYIAFLLIYLGIVIALFWYIVSLNLSWIFGAPFVPTSQKEAERILARTPLEKGAYMMELGCGDGRVLRTAAKMYGVRGLGVDIVYLWLVVARFWAWKDGQKDLEFVHKKIQNTDLRQAQVVYLFLMTKYINSIKDQILSQLQPGTLVISHGFPIPYLADSQVDYLEAKRFSTYYYRIGKTKSL